MTKPRIITQEVLDYALANLDYNRVTGILTWKVAVSPKIKVGTEAGYFMKDMGYRRVYLLGVAYLSHRIAWVFINGLNNQPEFIDHKDTVRDHNWIDNLREATKAQNGMNCRIHKNNTLGLKGVSYCKRSKKFRAYIYTSDGHKHLGWFIDKIEASKVSEAARRQYHGDFYNNSSTIDKENICATNTRRQTVRTNPS